MSCQGVSGFDGYTVPGCQRPRRGSRCYGYLKPLISFVVSVMLALSMSHLCEKYTGSDSFDNLKSDLSSLRINMNSLMESRDELSVKLMEINDDVPKLSEVVSQLRAEIVEGIEIHAAKLQQTASNLRNLIKMELQLIYEDNTGKTDYALEYLGGSILSVRDTRTYDFGAPLLKIFGMPICTQQNKPRAIIQPNSFPGECWAIAGNRGSVVIQLVGEVNVSGFSLEHISSAISPTGETSTAPKDFSVWGLKEVEDKNPFLFGEYTYDNTESRIQFFPVKNVPKQAYEIVELKVLSNSGNPAYTCIYRFRVHGILASFPRGIS